MDNIFVQNFEQFHLSILKISAVLNKGNLFSAYLHSGYPTESLEVKTYIKKLILNCKILKIGQIMYTLILPNFHSIL